jgi:hypothetical protein
MDPVFKGLRCAEDADCLAGTGCVEGLCRCTGPAQCPASGYACAAPLAGTPGSGNVCRAVSRSGPGLRVYRDVMDRWANSRPTWNQHAYSVTNVGDTGAIPRASQVRRNWQTPGLNNFRQNVQGDMDPMASPDLTSRISTEVECSLGTAPLSLGVCNRGAAPVASGIQVAFYQGDPRQGGTLVCLASTPQANPGTCTTVTCNIPVVPGQVMDIWARVDDNGTGLGSAAECEEGNNLARYPGFSCGG